MKKILSAFTLAFLVPALAFAQFAGVDNFVGNINLFINQRLVPLIFAIAFLVFLWGVFKYFILGGGDEGKREEGRQLMLYAIIGFVLMVSIWGIVNLLSSGLDLDDQEIQNIPNAPTSNTGGGAPDRGR